MRKLLLHPLFIAGLLLRLGLIAVFLPSAATDWYVPFLNSSIAHPALDPWSTWLALGGTPVAFPYGIVMWLAFLPAAIFCHFLPVPLLYGYGLTLLAADLGLLATLRKLLPNRDQLLLGVYWLSPIVLLASYVLGYNDLIPVLLLALSLYSARQLKFAVAGALLVAAISAKLSMVLALPFFGIYLFHNRALRQLLPDFIKGAAAAAVILGLPFLFSAGGLQMLFSNPEIGKIYTFALSIGGGRQIYFVPLVYLLMLYAAWRVRRLNFEMFQTLMGLAFLAVVLLTPASPGWFIWALPLLVSYQAASGRIAILLTAALSGLYVVSSLLMIPLTWAGQGHFDAASLHLPDRAISLLHTGMIAIGTVLALRIWRQTISLNDYFRLSRKPFVIGVAGDSGAGKDTFVNALAGLFGSHSVTKLSGDDYHLWDRQKPIWHVMTHLNPMSNDLEGFANDLVSLTDGKPIQSRHYDHDSGKMSRPERLSSNDFIIASGLHALYLPILRNCYNLSIYLDIDEGLRRHLKIARDVGERGHAREKVLASLERREPDSAKFIRPQAAAADLVLSLQPIHPRMLDEGGGPLRFKLLTRARNSLNELSLMRALVGICGLHVDVLDSGQTAESRLSIEGEATAQDIALAAKMLCPRTLEFLDITPDWQDGVLGLMQLIAISHVDQALTERFI